VSPARQAHLDPTDTPPVERQVVVDMIRRSLPALPVVVLVAGLIWGVDGALSAVLAIGLVLLNFLISAAILSWAARISLAFLMGAALIGFVARAALVTGAVVLVKDLAWVKLMPLAVMLLVTHLGLLIWETKHVSASLAFPSVLPRRGASG
jgi:hypothetical protein